MVHERRAVYALAALSAATFCYVTTEVLPIGLLTLIAPDLGRSRSEAGLLVTGYAVVVMIVALPLTRVTRRVPRRPLLAGALGVFAAATTVSAFATSYEVLLAARLVSATTNGVFWAVVFPVAISMFPANIRGRIVARLSIGNALGPVLGVPLSTWLGGQAGWRAAFVAMAVFGFVTCIAVALLLPSVTPQQQSAGDIGPMPDRPRFVVLLFATILAVTGAMGAFTYMTVFLLDVSGFAAASLGLLLFVQGSFGVAGTWAVGRVLDRFPLGVVLVLLGLLTAAMLGLYGVGASKALTIPLLAVAGMSFSSLIAGIQHRVMQVAPSTTDMASASLSVAFNFGLAAGSLIGAGLLATAGVRVIPLFGGLLTAVAIALLAGHEMSRRRGRNHTPDHSSWSVRPTPSRDAEKPPATSVRT
ncbi:MFS transporter [Micromonospora saelicesensis]|uniref:MFS transporter, DHA1 family, L-arabinose/isopropyl-beta-D-thiogalactopyranoside export protein n=1 Tax=Micromonospora saelicesensis TaxID=285676 RepID=A0A1C4UIE1_9ACTN|nr:MFS transporter [Micromonospora saelicesensis]RAO40461.1 putative MFS-type transporter [Micromonospora saelicesensis]RAO41658.1 putative MFS-type transporter [Micromonospora saelicesensis]RAO58504.1 putative MFS-type transporter [Micromonospora saelicesensis]SCE71476.1 MFS transporter, DHA1 family, L-arabinose/isopropyl-beta-D-thiogalactopyranoside export protein [Micromonospora saelicesensis]